MIKVGIYGFGNLGRGVLEAVQNSKDMELVGVFTRRDPASLNLDVPVFPAESALTDKRFIQVMILCGGSATDLPEQTPLLARHYTVVDSFDNHAKIPEHFAAVNKAAVESGNLALISAGWDPGLFSLQRLLGNVFLPDGNDYTFWGRGVSQGHSDAIRRIDGVLDARQYTNVVPEALARVRNGENPVLSTREKHTRECYVVVEDGADKARIEREICEMPNYFADYDTTVHFVSQETLEREHGGLPHGGVVIRTGETANGTKHMMEHGLKLESNPSFTASVLVAYARAARKMRAMGQTGCKTVLDVPPAFLSPEDGASLRQRLL